MLNQPTLDKLAALKLTGMAAAYERWVRSSNLAHFAHLNWPTCTPPDVTIQGCTGGINWNYLR
jgi:hypothetical protein